MDFSWNDWVMLKDGVTAEIAEQKNIQSALAVTNISLVSYFTGMEFEKLLDQFKLNEKGKINESSDSGNTQKNIQQSQRLLEQVFEGDDE